MIPGASYPAKSYSIEKFVELTKQIDANFLTIWGSEKERIMEQWALSEQSFELKKILNNGAFFYLKQKNKGETREKK